MLVLEKLILCACISRALADGAQANPPTSIGAKIDGFSLLRQENGFSLVQTDFDIQNTTTYRCISVTIKGTNEDKLEVTVEARYNNVTGDSWKTYEGAFTFETDSTSERRIMKSDSGVFPPGTYTFLKTDPRCTVVEVKDSQHHNVYIDPQAKNAGEAHGESERGNCMLWVKTDDKSAPDIDCYTEYSKICPNDVRDGFSKIKCDERQAGTAPEESP